MSATGSGKADRKGLTFLDIMELYRNLGVIQRTAWFMLHGIRTAFAPIVQATFEGPVEADETYIRGKEFSKHEHEKLKAGPGKVDKAAIAGIKDRKISKIRAQVVESIDGATLKGSIYDNTQEGVMLLYQIIS